MLLWYGLTGIQYCGKALSVQSIPLIAPSCAGELIPGTGHWMRIIGQVFWLRGHPKSLRPSRLRGGHFQWRVRRPLQRRNRCRFAPGGAHGIPYSFRPMPEHPIIEAPSS